MCAHAIMASSLQESQQRKTSSNPTVYHESEHISALLRGLFQLQREGLYTDLTLLVDGQVVPVHRHVLAAACPQLHARIREADRLPVEHRATSAVELAGMDYDVFSSILEFVYTGTLALNMDVVQGVLLAAHTLGLPGLHEACIDFMVKHVDLSTALDVHQFAKCHAVLRMEESAYDFLLANFTGLAREKSFLEMNHVALMGLLADDRLNVPSEDPVFEAVETWFQRDPTQRSVQAMELIQYVRFPFCSPAYFYSVVENSDLVRPHVSKHLLREYRKYHAEPNQRHNFLSVVTNRRTVPRMSFGLTNVVMILGGYKEDSLQNRQVCFLDLEQKYCWKSRNMNLPFETMEPHKVTLTLVGSYMVVMLTYCSNMVPASHVWAYDMALGVWQDITFDKPYRTYAAIVECGGSLYVTGGVKHGSGSPVQSQQSTSAACIKSQTFALHWAKKSWQPVQNMKESVYAHAATSYKGQMYVFGGKAKIQALSPSTNGNGSHDADPDAYSQASQVYQPARDTWRRLTVMPLPCSSGSALVHMESIFLVGAHRKYGSAAAVTLTYSPRLDTWTMLQPPTLVRHLAAAVVVGGKVVVMGGCGGDKMEEVYSSLETFDPSTERWISGGEFPFNSQLPVSMAGHGAIYATVPIDI